MTRGGGASSPIESSSPVVTAPAAPVPAPAAVAFNGNVLLGAPTTDTVRISVLSPEQTGTVSVAFGTATGNYERQTVAYALQAGQPLEIVLDGLATNTRYFYRLDFRAGGTAQPSASEEYRFQTARPAGSRFTFTIQADSHLDENSDLDLYRRTLANVAIDAPDSTSTWVTRS